MKYLVTGGAGFIGSHIAEALIRRGDSVRIFDNFSAGREENLKSIRGKIELVRGDLRETSDVAKAVRGIDIVFHEGAIRSVPRSIDDPMSSNDANISGTLKLLMACRKAGVKRLVYASSSSVYGDNKTYPQVETLKPSPISPYAVSKLTAELYAVMFAKTFGLETVSLRYFNVFGPRQALDSQYAAVIPKFMDAALFARPVEVHSDGRQSRDFTYIDNVVYANLLAASRPGIAGEYLNIACGETHSLLDIIRQLEKMTGHKLKRKHLPERTGDVRKTCANISKAKRLLRYSPPITFKEGLRRTWEWYKAAQGKGTRNA